jgi:hypothetical protein
LRCTLERVKGIEPSSQAWEARILPLDHTRTAHSLKRRLSPVKPADGFAPALFNQNPPRGRFDFAAVRLAHVEIVNRRAALGQNARRRDVHAQIGERLR